MTKILMVAVENYWWGAVRLPQFFVSAGAQVAVLCSRECNQRHSSFVEKFFDLKARLSRKEFSAAFVNALGNWQPDLVIPCDENAVAMLHCLQNGYATQDRAARAQNFAILERSLGQTDALKSMNLKYYTRLLAEKLGIPTPPSEKVETEDQALAAAQKFGFPVFLKKSFSWGGTGTIPCKSPAEVRAGFKSFLPKVSWLRRITGRGPRQNWLESEIVIEVQKPVGGADKIMLTACAYKGELLCSFMGTTLQEIIPQGPSTIVELGNDEFFHECKAYAQAMIAETGASGFISYDFLRCSLTGTLYLLECNPRPTQSGHLGQSIGADLVQALVSRINNKPFVPSKITQNKIVAFFPQEWLRNGNAAKEHGAALDIPTLDPKLFKFILQFGKRHGRSPEILLADLSENGLVVPN